MPETTVETDLDRFLQHIKDKLERGEDIGDTEVKAFRNIGKTSQDEVSMMIMNRLQVHVVFDLLSREAERCGLASVLEPMKALVPEFGRLPDDEDIGTLNHLANGILITVLFDLLGKSCREAKWDMVAIVDVFKSNAIHEIERRIKRSSDKVSS